MNKRQYLREWTESVTRKGNPKQRIEDAWVDKGDVVNVLARRGDAAMPHWGRGFVNPCGGVPIGWNWLGS